MSAAIDKFTVIELGDYQNIRNELCRRWTALESVPNIFRYKLNVRRQKVLEGRYGFFVQVKNWPTEDVEVDSVDFIIILLLFSS